MSVTREISLQKEEDKIVLRPNIGELYARKIGDLKSLVQNDATKHQATEIIRSLIEQIVVSTTGQRGKSDVVLNGALASILAYANDTAQSGVVSSSQKTSPYSQACSHLATARILIGNITQRKLQLLNFCTCIAAVQHYDKSIISDSSLDMLLNSKPQPSPPRPLGFF